MGLGLGTVLQNSMSANLTVNSVLVYMGWIKLILYRHEPFVGIDSTELVHQPYKKFYGDGSFQKLVQIHVIKTFSFCGGTLVSKVEHNTTFR